MLLCLTGGSVAEPRAATAADSPAALFNRLDANHDGQLTSDEVPADRQQLFLGCSTRPTRTATGGSAADEFAGGIQSQRTPRPLHETPPASTGGPFDKAQQMFERWDANHDGQVVPDEVPDQGRGRFERLLARADGTAMAQ